MIFRKKIYKKILAVPLMMSVIIGGSCASAKQKIRKHASNKIAKSYTQVAYDREEDTYIAESRDQDIALYSESVGQDGELKSKSNFKSNLFLGISTLVFVGVVAAFMYSKNINNGSKS
ncbi:MAG: hypothetical protein NkDv07_0565 [Candidatus Improbicoccus devescovinae]|nr:MAG: hypothetical protein NkDv07_0565 [Candidatus Improbicoccus devescovinae]